MMTRNILMLAGAALMLATSFSASAATTSSKPSAPSTSQSCKGYTGTALKDCMAKQKHAVTKPAAQPKK